MIQFVCIIFEIKFLIKQMLILIFLKLILLVIKSTSFFIAKSIQTMKMGMTKRAYNLWIL